MAIKISNTTVITDSREIVNLATPLDVSQGGSGSTSFGTGVLLGNGSNPFTTKANPAGAFVGTTDIQTLTNKTLGSGTTIIGAICNNVIIGAVSPAPGTFTTLTATGATSLNNLSVTGSTQLGDFGTDIITLVGQVVANNSTGSNGQVLTSRGPNLSPQWTSVSGGGGGGGGTSKVVVENLSLGSLLPESANYTFTNISNVAARAIVVLLQVTSDRTQWDLEIRGAGSSAGQLYFQAIDILQPTYQITFPFFYENDLAEQSFFIGVRNRSGAVSSFFLDKLQVEKFA